MSGVDEHRFPMFTGDVRGGGRGRGHGELLPDSAHAVIVHFPI